MPSQCAGGLVRTLPDRLRGGSPDNTNVGNTVDVHERGELSWLCIYVSQMGSRITTTTTRGTRSACTRRKQSLTLTAHSRDHQVSQLWGER